LVVRVKRLPTTPSHQCEQICRLATIHQRSYKSKLSQSPPQPTFLTPRSPIDTRHHVLLPDQQRQQRRQYSYYRFERLGRRWKLRRCCSRDHLRYPSTALLETPPQVYGSSRRGGHPTGTSRPSPSTCNVSNTSITMLELSNICSKRIPQDAKSPDFTARQPSASASEEQSSS
jgi:hypothetical protein